MVTINNLLYLYSITSLDSTLFISEYKFSRIKEVYQIETESRSHELKVKVKQTCGLDTVSLSSADLACVEGACSLQLTGIGPRVVCLVV